jgi:hypothetical protein
MDGTFSLALPKEILDELREAARERNCSPLCFAQETIHFGPAVQETAARGVRHAWRTNRAARGRSTKAGGRG